MFNGDAPASSVRIVVVDDFEPWRRRVCHILQTAGMGAVAQAADGLEAVQKVEELKPDLMLLDIGLPNLGGLEVANRIHQIDPGVRIIFLTQNSDIDFVRAAFSSGARGYVLKTDAWAELLPAVTAILGGGDFVSSGIKDGG